MPTPTIGYARQFPMLTSGLTNTMPSADSSQQQMEALFQMLASQIQNQGPPQMEQVPNAPSPGIAFLSQLLGNVGGALAQTPMYSQQVAGTLANQREAVGQAEQRNLQRSNTFDLQRQSLMMDLAMKRLDVGIGQAKQAKDAETEQKLLQMKADLQAKQQQIDFEHDMAKIDEAQKLQTEREAMKQQGQNERVAKREAAINERQNARATKTIAGSKGKAKVSTKTPSSNWPTQYMKAYTNDLADAKKALDAKLKSDEVKTQILGMGIGGPNAKKVKAVREQYTQYKQDLFNYYQQQVDDFMRKQGAAPEK